MVLISIIIPVYNTQDYLEKCLNSVINQTYTNIEIILVNDGSNDNSLEICKTFEKMDSRVRVYNQTNQGQATARNYGIGEAKGEYILFVDSDDIIAGNHVERLMSLASEYKVDLVQCEYKKFKKEQLILFDDTQTKIIKEYSAEQALEEFCYQRIFNASPWGKLIRKELLDDLRFPVGMGYEDFAMIYQLIGSVKRLVYTNEVLYFYRQHTASTMHTVFSDKKIDRVRIAYKLKEYIHLFYPSNDIAVNNRFLLANFQVLMDVPFERQYMALRKEIWNNIKNSRKIVIFDRKTKKSLRLMAIMSYAGLYMMMILGRGYRTIIV